MKPKRITLDTNILIYALDKQQKEKHKRAKKILEYATSTDCVLILQSLCEFYYATTRKNLISSEVAYNQVQDWITLFPIISASHTTLSLAIEATQAHQLSFWDAMLWSAAYEGGVTLLFTENFNHNQILRGVKILNPFQVKNLDEIQ